MRRTTAVLLVVVVAFVLPWYVMGQTAEELARVDRLIDEERPEEAIDILSSLLSGSTGADRAEVLWRLASATLMLGDHREDDGAGEDELVTIFEEGEAYGNQAIEADPTNSLGYYWTSANIGRWGQTKGVLNSLFRAPDMRDLLTQAVTRDPEHADSYYVLGQLYAQVPGMISFGNVEYAVSLGRKSVALMEEQVASGERDEINEDFSIQLASHLIDRDWNARRRRRNLDDIREAYREADTPIERGFFFEGTLDLSNEDDVEEAESLLRDTIRRLESIGSPTPSDRRRLEEAQELMDSIS